MRSKPESAWGAGTFQDGGARVLFGRMYEDPEIELGAFAVGARVFAIASAGCTARALAAARCRVTAVDINPRQLAYARARGAGEAAIDGDAERLMARGRRLLGLVGWSEARLRAFLELGEPAEQAAYWRARLDTARWRGALDALFLRPVLGLFYAGGFTAALPCDFGRRLRERLYRCCATHANRANPYLRSLLLGEHRPEPGTARLPIEFVCADAASYLEACAPGSFDGFTLSNIGDGASAAYMERLWAAVRRAAAPGAVIVMRSFGEPLTAAEARWAARERCGIWGRVHVETQSV